MSNDNSLVDAEVAVLGWAVPRPTGRWHQSIVVTSRHVWVSPELSFAEDERMRTAAHEGTAVFHEYVRSAGWQERAERFELETLRGLNWGERTGLLRFAHGTDQITSVLIPNRDTGNKLVPMLQTVFKARKAASQR